MTNRKWALILGASSGFGEATAVELATKGADYSELLQIGVIGGTAEERRADQDDRESPVHR